MDESADRELDAILNLIKMTQDGVVKWYAIKPRGDLIENESTKYSNVMYCTYMDKRLRLYIEHKRIDRPSGINQLVRLAFLESTEQTYPYWVTNVVLEISNAEGQSLWRFPSKPATKDLLDAAKYQIAGVKDILDSLIQGSAESA